MRLCTIVEWGPLVDLQRVVLNLSVQLTVTCRQPGGRRDCVLPNRATRAWENTSLLSQQHLSS